MTGLTTRTPEELCDYCLRYAARFVVRSDDEVTEVCARHLALTVDRLAEGQDNYLTVAPLLEADDDDDPDRDTREWVEGAALGGAWR